MGFPDSFHHHLGEFPCPAGIGLLDEICRDLCEQNWLVVSTRLKNMSQMGTLPQIVMKIKNI